MYDYYIQLNLTSVDGKTLKKLIQRSKQTAHHLIHKPIVSSPSKTENKRESL